MYSQSTAATESRARRAARRFGYVARKSRWRCGSIDNKGGFQIIDVTTNIIVAGEHFQLKAQEVIDFLDR